MGMKGDFLSFSFAGKDSSEFNIVRTSDGDRYDEELTSEIKDITAEIPGMDGEYFFGSTYGTRTFEIPIAFDSLTEEQFRKMRKHYGRRKMGSLIFSERPYKKYMVKIESPIELSYVCFDEPKKELTTVYGIGNKDHEVMRATDKKERIYKGDGTITFVAYFPFAKSAFKELPYTFKATEDTEIKEGKKYFVYDENTHKYIEVENPVTDDLESYSERVLEESIEDWAVSSGILSAEDYETVDKYDNEQITVYNPGDLPTGFRLYIPSAAAAQGVTLSYEHSEAQSGDLVPQLTIKPIESMKTNQETYSVVENPTGNPKEQGWYEATAYNYVLSEDTEVDATKTYFTVTTATDEGILIDTNTGLIVGVSSISNDQDMNATYTTSGNLYNEYIESGYFFKLQPDEYKSFSALKFDTDLSGCKIFYDYLYF